MIFGESFQLNVEKRNKEQRAKMKDRRKMKR